MTSENQSDRRLLEELATEALRERRARRRWGIFFRALFFAYLIFVTALALRDAPTADAPTGEHSAVVDIEGVIAAGGGITGDGADAASVNRILRRAFDNEDAKGIILRVNSPGGSAVESNRIFKEIMRLKAESGKKVVAVAGDNCASGGYFIAAAADEIYVDEASIVGSIGVIYGGFGFAGAMEKLGVERRVVTAGENKNMLDPFSPLRAADAERIGEILDDVHRVFIDAVKRGRGERLAGDDEIFNGGIYGGLESVELGLADGVGDARHVAREVIGAEKMLVYRDERPWPEEFLDRFSVSAARALAGMFRGWAMGG